MPLNMRRALSCVNRGTCLSDGLVPLSLPKFHRFRGDRGHPWHGFEARGRDGFHVAANTRFTCQLLYHQRWVNVVVGRIIRSGAKLGNVPDLATMDCAHFPRNNVVRIEGRPVGVDRSNIRFLRWQLVHQSGPLLLNHLSDIV